MRKERLTVCMEQLTEPMWTHAIVNWDYVKWTLLGQTVSKVIKIEVEMLQF